MWNVFQFYNSIIGHFHLHSLADEIDQNGLSG